MKKTTKTLICGILEILVLAVPVSVLGELSNLGSIIAMDEDMEPYLKSNDIITYSNSTSFDSLRVGDVIVLRAPVAVTEDGKPKLVVHRISEIGTFLGKKVVTTKGDANPYSLPGIDFPIFAENYIGKVVTVTNTTMTTYVETETETRTFEDCFNEGIGFLTLGLIFAPTAELSAADLIDPAYKKMVINLCNFYHEKTGLWVEVTNKEQTDSLTKLYGKEFYEKYNSTFPEKFKNYFEKATKAYAGETKRSPTG